MSNHGPRVLAIGLGEATWDRIDHPDYAPHLPFLRNLASRRARGVTLAPQPLDVSTSWANVITGRSPGGHGIFTSLVPDAAGGFRYVGPGDLGAPPVWQILGEAGVPTGTINVQLNDPEHAPPEAGFVITHDPRPKIHSRLVHPPELYRDLTARFGRWDTGAGTTSDAAWIKATSRQASVRTDVLIDVLQTRPWRFALIHLHEIAKAQHRFWDDGTNRLQETYSLTDESVRRIADAVGPDAYLFLFSECGAGPIRSSVHLNAWLAQEGHLRRRTGATRQAGLTAARLQRRIRRFLPHAEILTRLKMRFFGKISASTIDWEATRAYAPGNTDQILFTVPDDEKAALAAEITAGLLALRDVDGNPVVEKVIPREAWHSTWEHTPDLLVVWSDDAYMPVESFEGAESPVFEDWVQPGLGKYVGSHRRHGMLLVDGPGVGAADLGTVSTLDLAPTWLDLLGAALPSDLEGSSFAAALLGR